MDRPGSADYDRGMQPFLILEPTVALRAYDLLLRMAPPPADPRQVGSIRVFVSVQRAAALASFRRDCARRRRYDPPLYDSRAELARLRRTMEAVKRSVPGLAARLRRLGEARDVVTS